MYWSPQKMLTHNAMVNIICGNRGGGKTYASQRYVLNRWHKTNEEFIVLTRYKTELTEEFKNSFLAKLQNSTNPKDKELTRGLHVYKGKICGGGGVLPSGKRKPRIIAGHFVALSKAQDEKKKAYPLVKTILFDEFLLESHSLTPYLKEEPMQLLSLYDTVDRYQDKVRIIMLANCVTTQNPYFIDWGITTPYYGTSATFKNGLGYIETVQDINFIKTISRTRSARFKEGTKYGEYSINNKFLEDNPDLIEQKTGDCRCFLIIKHKGLYVGLWYSNNLYFVSKDITNYAPIYAISQNDLSMNENYIFALKKSLQYQSLLKAIDYNLIRFENQFCKKMFQEICTKLRR